MTLSVTLADEAATVALGEKLGRLLPSGGIVFLLGTLGAGKTTLTRGILRSCGHYGAVKSPTYTLVEPYDLPGRQVYHFDLYRLGDPEELEYMGIRDYFFANSMCIVEWPAKGDGYLPAPDITVTLMVEASWRVAQISADSGKGEQLLNQL